MRAAERVRPGIRARLQCVGVWWDMKTHTDASEQFTKHPAEAPGSEASTQNAPDWRVSAFHDTSCVGQRQSGAPDC